MQIYTIPQFILVNQQRNKPPALPPVNDLIFNIFSSSPDDIVEPISKKGRRRKRGRKKKGLKMTKMSLDVGIFLADPVRLAVSSRRSTLQAALR